MRDRRKEQRWPALLGGTIACERGVATAPCTVRNTSRFGARLEVPHTLAVPEAFDLAIARRETSYRVRRRWSRDGEIGVEIESVHVAKRRPPVEQARRIRRLQDENAALRQRIADLSE